MGEGYMEPISPIGVEEDETVNPQLYLKSDFLSLWITSYFIDFILEYRHTHMIRTWEKCTLKFFLYSKNNSWTIDGGNYNSYCTVDQRMFFLTKYVSNRKCR